LAEQRRVNDAIRQNCDDISYRNDELKASNARLFEHARYLSKNIDQIKSDLLELRANLTLSQEVVVEGLAGFDSKAPELDVLREMDEHDAIVDRIRQRQLWLQNVENASANLSFLQLSARAHRAVHSAKQITNRQADILQQVKEDLDEMTKENNGAVMLIAESFQEQSKHNLEYRTALLNQQAQLNESTADALRVHEQLLSAVNNLTSVYESLNGRRQAVKRFAANLGSTPADDIERKTKSKRAC
jgi:hypothetical protein